MIFQENRLLKYHTIFCYFWKSSKIYWTEIWHYFNTDLAVSTLIWHSFYMNLTLLPTLIRYCFNIGLTSFPNWFSICWKYAIICIDITSFTVLQRGISEPIFYGDLVYKFKRIVGKPNFSDQFKKIVKRYIRVGYNLDIMRQSACLVVNPITVYSYGFLFNCTTVGQASDSMTALT